MLFNDAMEYSPEMLASINRLYEQINGSNFRRTATQVNDSHSQALCRLMNEMASQMTDDFERSALTTPIAEPLTQSKIDRVFGLNNKLAEMTDKGRRRLQGQRLRQRWHRAQKNEPTFEEIDKFEKNLISQGFE